MSVYKRLVEGKEDVEDHPKTGKPSSLKTDANIEKDRQLIYSNLQLITIIRIMADELGIAKEKIRNIFVENSGMQKVCRNVSTVLDT